MRKVLNARARCRQAHECDAGLNRAPEQMGQPVRYRARRFSRRGNREISSVDRRTAWTDGRTRRASRPLARVLVRTARVP